MEKIRAWFDNIEMCKEAIEKVYRLNTKDKMVVSALLKKSCDILDAYGEDIPNWIHEDVYMKIESIIWELFEDNIVVLIAYAEHYNMSMVDAFYYGYRPEQLLR